MNKKLYVLILTGLLLIVGVLGLLRFFPVAESKPSIVNVEPRFKVDYKSDRGFLECLGVQHSCIYDHLSKKQYEFIIEDCHDENFCNK